MFAKAVPLKSDEHRNLSVLETNDYSYARGEILAPIIYDEMADIAREYPIVFPSNGSNMPAALLGLEPGKNAYVADDGHWHGTYIPTHIQRYPFAFYQAPGEADPNRFTIVFDAEAPHFRAPNGHPVFGANGQLSDHMTRRAELLKRIQEKTPMTMRLVDAIDKAGILVERAINIRTPGGAHRVSGLRVVDEKQLNALSHEAFAALRDTGALTLVYAHLLSWANFRQGPLGGKYPELAAKPQARNPEFLFEDEDDDELIDFSRL